MESRPHTYSSTSQEEGLVESMPSPDDERERFEQLRRLLGEPLCRQLGIFPMPDGLVVSVVIPCTTSGTPSARS